jgi:elongation factor P--beta-lysine ligase
MVDFYQAFSSCKSQLEECEKLLALVERRAAIIQKISEIEAHEERQVLNNLFKTSDNQVLSQSSSSDDASLNSDEEYLQYN